MRTADTRNLSNMLTHMREKQTDRQTDRQTKICLGDRRSRKFDEKKSGRVFKHTQDLTRDLSKI